MSRHSVFAAGLVVLSNQFASLYNSPDADTAIESCISILRYCAEHDAQAARVTYIVETFREANLGRCMWEDKYAFPGRKVPTIIPLSSNPHHDPVAHFFARSKNGLGPPPILTTGGKLSHSMPAAHPLTLPPMVPSVLQQPSPDATGASPVHSSVISAGMHGMDAMGQEVEFHFDSLWPTWHPPNGSMSMSHHVEPTENFGNYTLAPPPAAIGSHIHPNANIPLYQPSSNF